MFLLADRSRFLQLSTTPKEAHLEQTEPARAELVFALTVLEREKLDELVDEDWV